jgi:hypothetical protein
MATPDEPVAVANAQEERTNPALLPGVELITNFVIRGDAACVYAT